MLDFLFKSDLFLPPWAVHDREWGKFRRTKRGNMLEFLFKLDLFLSPWAVYEREWRKFRLTK
jgi:hypothetical protein